MSMETQNKIRIMLAAPASIMGSSLRTFLRTMTDVELTGFINNPGEIQAELNKQNPNILLVDADLIDQLAKPGIEAMLTEISHTFSNIRTIVLVNSFSQKSAAVNAHSGQVLLKGELGDQLRKAILG